jgi:hypothetical protein
MLATILLVFAFVLFVIAAFGWTPKPPISLGWLGLACWVLSILLRGVHV